MPHSVSVIVPHYSDLTGLERCLAALSRQTVAPAEIIVADNGSPEGESAVAAAIAGRARLIIVPEKGAGPARNGGVAASSGDLLAFTDADCLPDPEWLQSGLAALTDYDFVGGAVEVVVENPADVTPTEAFERVFAFDNRDYVTRKGFTVTANLFCSRTVFDQVGGFRVGVPEDLEWCARARARGYRLGYAAAAIVGHPGRTSWLALRRKWERLNAEAFGLALAERNGRMRWFVKALAMPLSAIAHTPRVLRSTALTRASDRLKALQVLYRLRAWRAADSLRLLTLNATSYN